jgi:Niemann-Pick C1 protein
VALIIIDERRVADKRRDWIFCSTVKSRVGSSEVEEGPQESWFDRFMGWYADFLFNPLVAAFVLIAFAALLAVCAYSTSKLTQDFQFTDVVPKDSYVADFWGDFTEHSEQTGVAPGVYFRFVDQCDPAMQQQMEDYINDLVAMKEVNDQPFYFWLRDFKSFVNKTLDVQDLECKDQIAAFLEEPVYYDLYNRHIIMADNGEVISSRTSIRMDNVDQERVTEQVDALENQRSVSRSQPINRDRKDWAFFTWDGLYYIWEFYAVSPRELAQTTIAGVVAVSVIGMIFIPHWSAVIFVTPMISVLYVDLLGVLQFAGIHVNAVSYVSLIMSIGLLVDFLMHILLRFYESRGENRKAKVKDTLQTMGSSILVGAISTFLGVIPLAFSSSEIFNTIFVTFIGLVTLGAGHGLILFPVILSLIGPEVCTEENSQNPQKEVDNKKTLENFETTCPVDDGSESDSNIEYEV